MSRRLPRRSALFLHRRRMLVVAAVLGLLAAVAIGWGTPAGVGEGAAHRLTAHAQRVAEMASDAVVAVAAPVTDAVAARANHGDFHEHARTAFGTLAGAVALLLLVAHRRRLAFARPRTVRAALVAHSGRAPPV